MVWVGQDGLVQVVCMGSLSSLGSLGSMEKPGIR